MLHENSRNAISIFLKCVGTFTLMVLCGVVALIAAASFLMNLGLKYHDNYEYFGGFLGKIIVLTSSAIGFVAPANLIWYLRKHAWQLSLRAWFIAIFVVAMILGIYTLSL